MSALADAARSMHETEKELKSFTQQSAEGMKDNLTRIATELGGFQRELEKFIQDHIGRFNEIIGEQKKISEGTNRLFEDMSQVFKHEEEQLKEQHRIMRLGEAQMHNDRAIVLFHRGNYEVALIEIKEALKIEEASEYYNNLALITGELGNHDDSREAYKKAIELSPNSAEVYNNLGLLYLKLKDYDNAIAIFTEATKRHVNYALAYTNLGHAFASRENFDEAIKAWEKALEIDPTNNDARESLKLYKEGRIDGYTAETKV